MLFYLISSLLTSSLIALARRDAFQSRCDDFASKIDLPNVRVNLVDYVASGTNLSLPDNDPSCGAPSQSVSADMCRVAMAVYTSDNSEITLEAWFPRDYTGRFLSTGNGGLGGCIQYYDLAYTTGMGFATVGANNGHNGTSGKPFYKHPDAVEDYAYRSIHTGVVIGKQLTKLFYDEGFDKSYYIGCSTGGRQGFKTAQKFPDDFDGVVAGAPAFNMLGLLSWSANFFSITGAPGSETYLSPAEWKLAHDEILRQCDDMDGAKDGIIEDPDLCHPTMEAIICDPDSSSSSRLTGTQAKTVREILSPLHGANGTLIYPRMQPGSETRASTIMYTGEPFIFSREWWQYVVYSDPSWDASQWSVQDAAAALKQNPFDVHTWPTDLSAFRDAGGKLLTYHGLQDHLISSEISKLYYARVAETMALPSARLDDFYRLFPISGMAHCGDGDGAYGIGNGASTHAGNDPEDNVLMAVVRWVEEGVAPETVRGARFEDGVGSRVEYTRRHCRYPRRNVYRGPGKFTDEDAWECV
ncbi:putative feruloyl esterase [Aspergillus candidus]|uniref:Carboxylic ester hydrolase n=1 Tax=Aspergillus candidus TaxID=41067 RepID=A0A2I2FG65_ASPCN|nr:putative feruloyl esterase [Aspergillus candidus]PLB39626.1 putative feruloyl esterase [Aspergillus candidus]